VGGWSEFMYLPPRRGYIKVPDYIPVEYSCLSELFVVTAILDEARNMPLTRQRLPLGDTVVVQGAGPIGMLMVAKARMLGAGKIIALDNFPRNWTWPMDIWRLI
jgi:threonine dehydrogenase-like Zn-dependent dehydrogenase